FLPLGYFVLKSTDHKEHMAFTFIMQNIAANLGGMVTPFGNPQNLYLFSVSKMTSMQFFSITVPVTAISLVLLVIASLFEKKHELNIERNTEVRIINRRYLYLYTALFILCILSVFKIVDLISVFASVCVVVAIIQPKVFSKVDYGLLLTFVCFFIFVGNIKNIPEVTEFASEILKGHEFEATLAASQIISNVPSAVMMSAFTHNYKALILGSDIGGLGTLIASLASLISYKSYIRSENHNTAKFILVFTFMNIIFLAVLYTAAKLLIL
ncbi:MAG: SLC13 family permease, partial [Huintestinicola sp.]